MDALKRLQDLFRELFQLDLADLDFGLYRLFHLKRMEVEAFLNEQLPRRVREAFQSLAGQDARDIQAEVSALSERICREVDDGAICSDGEIHPDFRKTRIKSARKLIDEYEEKRRQLKGVEVTEAQQAEVFNHLHAFFSRYYDGGDFIPRRHYGSREHYAVPYRGEEVSFHWANKDQHYVKTGEAFKDYAFTVDTLKGPCKVRFSLTEASTPPGNTKGDTRYFFPLPEHCEWKEESRTFLLPFQYRLPTEQEVITFGKNSKFQEAVLQNTLAGLINAVPDPVLSSVLSETVEAREDKNISLLLKRLRHFCRKNTTDYFVHKNLDSFLNQELEFYVKDQVLHLADLDGDFEGKRRTLRTLRELAAEIITFLAQIEEVQKRLFEKRKFVIRTDYLVPIKEVPRGLWKEVLKNEAQMDAWKTLFHIQPEVNLFNKNGTVNMHFLEGHPTLVVNTEHFDSDFKDKLLNNFEDIDEATDGLLIHSENYQALRLLERKYAGKVKCIYIDPPYNTGSDEFIYKDRYRHSSWLAMMEERLRTSRGLVSEDGAVFISIDDNEVGSLKKLMSSTYGVENFIASLIWQKIFSPKSTARHFSEDHDYLLAFAKDGVVWTPKLLPRTPEADARYENPDSDDRGVWTSGDLTARNYYSEGQYELTSPSGNKFKPAIGTYWRVNRAKFEELNADNRIWWGANGGNMPRLKRFLTEVKQGIVPQTIWFSKDVGHTQEAKKELLAIVAFRRTEDVLNTVKPTRLVRRILEITTNPNERAHVLDFFAGSGTTGDAVLRQNREDGGRRQFILVEMGQYFRDIIMQRIQRAIYAPEWKDLEPKREATEEEVVRTPRLVKILCLESYEDALHNLTTKDTRDREARRVEAYKKAVGEDDFRLSYLVRLPLEASSTLLNISALEHPFDYKIEVLTEAGPKTENVDLVETFNYLYGLHVVRIEKWLNQEDGRSYRVIKAKDRNNRRVLVLWRDMKDLDPKVERMFVEKRLKDEDGFNEILINGDSAIPGVRSLDPFFKRLMEEGER